MPATVNRTKYNHLNYSSHTLWKLADLAAETESLDAIYLADQAMKAEEIEAKNAQKEAMEKIW